MGKLLKGRVIPRGKYLVDSIFWILMFIVLILFALSFLLPMLWAVLTSLKSNFDYMLNPFGFPDKLEFSNYVTAFEYFNIEKPDGTGTTNLIGMFGYSLLYSVGSAIIATLIPCLTAYVTAKFPFRFSKFVYSFCVVTMVIPIVGSLPSQLQVARMLRLYDTFIGMFLMKASYLGLYYLIFYATFKTLSKEYADAARVDGANNWVVMTSIMLPLVKNTIGIVMLLKFIEFWNDYQTPMLFMPSFPTVAYGLFYFNTANTNEVAKVPLQFAGCMLLFLPIMVVFILFHNKMIGNLTLGGLKG